MVVQEQSAFPSPNSKWELVPASDANVDDDETETARTDSQVSQQSSTVR